MKDETPDPLVPADVDLRDLDGFMLNTERLLASELWALTRTQQDAFRPAQALWCRAWKQVPAASLPDDDIVLAAFAELATARFRKLRGIIMRGFVLCSDGRFYHRVLAAEALRAWERKKAYETRREADRKRLEEWRKKHPRSREETPEETQDETRFVAEDTGQGQGQVRDSEERKKEGRGEPRDGKYAFLGEVIRLTPKDLDQWRETYHAVPDIIAELRTADAYYRTNPPKDGKWFFAASAWLKREHDRRTLEAKAPKASSFNL